MNSKIIFGALSLSALLITSCGKDTGGCVGGEKAVVKDFTDSDTCGIVFQLEDGTKLEPTNLAEFSGMTFENGDLLWVSYKDASGASTCGIGEIVKMKCINTREY